MLIWCCLLSQNLPDSVRLDGDWKLKCKQIVKLRHSFDMANVDGSDELEKDELTLILLSLDPKRAPSPAQINRVWGLMLEGAGIYDGPPAQAQLDWTAFLRGMARVSEDPVAAELMALDQPSGFPLVSLLIDIKVAPEEAVALAESWTTVEKFGVRRLEAMKRNINTEQLGQLLGRAASGTLRQLDPVKVRRIQKIRKSIIGKACLIGLVCNVPLAVIENFVMAHTKSDGVFHLYYTCNDCRDGVWDCTTVDPCNLASWGQMWRFWAALVPAIVLFVLLEAMLLGINAVKACCLLGDAYDFRLVPLNPVRFR